jgi:hypothetical protein
LLATDGIEQLAWAGLYLAVALRERRFLGLMFALEGAKSALVLFTEFVTKPPSHPVPGRFMHMFTLALSAVFLLLLQRKERHHSQDC